MKIIILSIILAATACIPVFSQTPTALPVWERKSAPAVILGRYVDWKVGDKCFPPGYWGNNDNMKDNSFPKEIRDTTAGTFTLVWDICYPLEHKFHGWSIMLFPGDTVRVDINKEAFDAYDAYKKKTPRDSITTPKLQELWKKAVLIEGGTFEQFPPIQMKGLVHGYSDKYGQAHINDTFDEWRQICWIEFQEVLKQLDSLDFSPAEREYRRTCLEQDYLKKLREFAFVKKVGGIKDKDSLALFEKQMTFIDPHAAELTYHRNITGFYACLSNMREEGKNYIKANGLQDSPLGRWFKELDEAKEVMNRVKAMQSISEKELSTLSPEFQVQIREVQEQLIQEAAESKESEAQNQETADSKGIRRDLPKGKPEEWLPKIVAEHKGRIVFIDFWATWCGPCLKGMQEMKSVKPELKERGVDFVYITNTTSSIEDWLKHIDNQSGNHYIVPKEKMNEMQIPEFSGAIPHYLIYDREGKLVKAIRGWESVETMMQELEKVE